MLACEGLPGTLQPIELASQSQIVPMDFLRANDFSVRSVLDLTAPRSQLNISPESW